MTKEPLRSSRIAGAHELTTELTARAMELENLAAKLQQRADAWRSESVRWAASRDTRASISSYRQQWVAEQAGQFAAWLRLAADHLFTLAATEAR